MQVERNHLRLWLTQYRYRDSLVWLGQISRDIGVKFTLKSPTISTHVIDPDVDEARRYLIEDLAYAIIGPALLEMIGEFDPGRLDAKNKSYKKHYKTLIDTPAVQVEAVTFYKLALNALYLVLKQDFSRIEVMPLKRESDFLKSIGRENEIEDSAVAQY